MEHDHTPRNRAERIRDKAWKQLAAAKRRHGSLVAFSFERHAVRDKDEPIIWHIGGPNSATHPQ